MLEKFNGKTKLQLLWQSVDPSKKKAESFDRSCSQHEIGWSGGFEQLSIYLGTLGMKIK